MTWIKTLLILILLVYVLVGLYLYRFQERIIFRSSELPKEHSFRFESDFDELNLEMEDGAMLNALHFKVQNPKGIIVYFHGNAGDLSRWGEIVEPFTKYQFEVLVVDYRGYGKSTGARTKAKMLQDAEAVYAQAASTFDQSKIIVYGRSLGGAFASHIASEFSPKQLILEAPFFSVVDVAKSFAWMYPVKPILKFDFENFNSISKVKCPIQIFHGDEDLVVPISSGRKLEGLNERVKFQEIAGGRHNNLAEFKGYWDRIAEVLD